MTTVLPDPGNANMEDHVTISHRFLEHAKVEADKGNRLQAAEKVWGGVAHAIKAIGEKRGWHHDGHRNITEIGRHLGKEFDRRRDFDLYLGSAKISTSTFTRTTRILTPSEWPLITQKHSSPSWTNSGMRQPNPSP